MIPNEAQCLSAEAIFGRSPSKICAIRSHLSHKEHFCFTILFGTTSLWENPARQTPKSRPPRNLPAPMSSSSTDRKVTKLSLVKKESRSQAASVNAFPSLGPFCETPQFSFLTKLRASLIPNPSAPSSARLKNG